MLVKVNDVRGGSVGITRGAATMLVREGSNVYEIPAHAVSRQLRRGVYLVDDSYLNYETLQYTYRYSGIEE